MAGRIRDDDIALVRERARIDEVVREYVSLKSAGGGSLKGLCPFHDERSPSFHVTPSRGMWYCFGCGEGGDVLSFLQKIDHLSFAEAVEKLASRTGVELRYVDGGAAINRQQGQRTRLVEAHKVAAAFYVEQLAGEEAVIGRDFLTGRGFDAEAAAHFGVGYAPKSWDVLTSYLRKKGFTEAELLAGGLVSQGNRGVYDRFRGRLVWPIRDLGGDVIGFGARKLFDDDDGPKYLNTPESPIYKKSQVLYGIDLSRREISKSQQAVIVEGYTDVMACHLAGLTTAVATCGTAFGTEHIKVLRRLLMDDDQMKGNVIFTFDGDAAGQKAALRAFEEDQRFVTQTYVAVEPTGLDPCDLRLQHGDAAVRSLIERRVPLFEFAIKSTLAGYDLESAEGRVAALRDAAPVVGKIRDTALRPEYTRRLAGWLGMDVETVAKAVAGGSVPAARPDVPRSRPAPARAVSPRSQSGPRRDPALVVEREALKCALQEPGAVADWYESVEETAFTHPSARQVHLAIAGAGYPSAERSGLTWIDDVLEHAADDEVRRLVRELAVEPLPAEVGQDTQYAIGMIARLLELDASRRIEDLRGRLQRIDPVAQATEYQQCFADLLALEDIRRSLRQDALGVSPS
ncbi:MAG: DNA primase [Dermatophilaceae bacterium]|nr:DNA primase [Dermatophilaceae bacterium]